MTTWAGLTVYNLVHNNKTLHCIGLTQKKITIIVYNNEKYYTIIAFVWGWYVVISTKQKYIDWGRSPRSIYIVLLLVDINCVSTSYKSYNCYIINPHWLLTNIMKILQELKIFVQCYNFWFLYIYITAFFYGFCKHTKAQ